MKPKTTWVLVASGGKARVYQRDRIAGLVAVPRMDFVNEQLPAREIMADKPGRTFDSAGSGRHAMEYVQDPTEAGEDRFAGEVTDALLAALGKNRFNRLVIAAAPAMLARLRRKMPEVMRGRVSAEVDRDYTDTPQKELESLLQRQGAL